MPLKILHPAQRCESCQHRALRLFCNLTPDILRTFAELGTSANLPRGATLFREGDLATSVFVVCAGQVKLSCASASGKTMILKVATPGDLLGLGAALAGLPYEVTAESIEPVELRHIPRQPFLNFLERFGEASLHAAQSMQTEYRSAFLDARLLGLAPSASARLAHVLLAWATHASCGHNALRFNLALTHEELGNMANLSRETVTRILSRLRRDKILAIRGAAVTILLPERLRELATV